ncbi:pyridoxal phosphate-dependent aminotransferase [Algoriphagus limi]|uniref:Aminotransferase n=1 Tax=Algoriphagus limi TaxID=2975273 RepID=A0ABT2G1R4_9BACT|nr:aminotransferase class I/II-fold pyridoxal phosphate-dependent enzyme [Algoriphagus limi]MCS5489212.1 aminotransferase class I/II-fold pyridoxal phosphate-dependent enzyme [Algoriphagus limi]
MKGFSNRMKTAQEYYFSAKLREVNQLIADGKPVINLGIGSPDLSPDPSVIQALQNTVSQSQTHGYQSYQGIPKMRIAMSDYYRSQFQVELNPFEEILPLMGSKEGILHISLAFLNPGDAVLIPDPGYPTYTSVTQLLECEAIYYPLLEDGAPDWDYLKNLDLSRIKLFWVNYPHMPTGYRGSKELFEKLVDFAKSNELILVNDNPYSHILNPEPLSILSIDGAQEVALELNSLSKTFNIPGWRVGMVCGKKDWIQAILRVKSNMDSGMFLGIQKGATAALKLGKTWYEDLNQHYSNRRKLVWELADLLGLSYVKDRSGLFVWGKVPSNIQAEELVDQLLYEKYIFITPGKIFGNAGKDYVRISLCMPEYKILEAIKRIKAQNL